MQAFAGGEQSTEPDGINKENIAAGDSAKLIEGDTEVEVVFTTGSDERSGTTDSAEPGCPYSGSGGSFPTAVHDGQLWWEVQREGGNLYPPDPFQTIIIVEDGVTPISTTHVTTTLSTGWSIGDLLNRRLYTRWTGW